MKRIKKAVLSLSLAIAFFVALSVCASAEGVDGYINEFSAVLPDGFSGELTDTESLTSAVGLESLVDFVMTELSGKRSELSSFCILLLGACAIGAAVNALSDRLSDTCRKGLSIVFLAVIFSQVYPLFSSVSESLGEANAFFSAAAPIMCSLELSGGGAGSAAVHTAGMTLTVAFVSAISSRLLPSVAVFGFVAGLLRTFGGSDAVATGAKNIYTRIIGIATLLISITLSLQTVIASAADSAVMRAARYGASTAIPIVGGTVSAALSALSGGVAYAKDIIGGAAIGAILYIFISPLALLFLYRLATSCAVFVSELLGVKELACLGAFSSLLDSLIASYALSAVLYVLEIVLFMKCGVGAV